MSDANEFYPTPNNSDDSDYNEQTEEDSSTSEATSDHDAEVSSEEPSSSIDSFSESEGEDLSSSEDEDEDDSNALRRQLFKDILRENVTYTKLRVHHIQNLSRALRNGEGEKIANFAQTHYSNRYSEAVHSELEKSLTTKLTEELQIRRNRGGCSSFFSTEYNELLSQIFSSMLCANCVVPQVKNTLIQLVNADAKYIADSILERAGGDNDTTLLLSKRAAGAAAEVLRELQDTSQIFVDCRPRKQRGLSSQVRRTDGIIYGCSTRALPLDNEMKIKISYEKEDKTSCLLYACVPVNTLLRDLLQTMAEKYEDIQKLCPDVDSTVYVREPFSFSTITNGARLIKIDNDIEVQRMPKLSTTGELAFMGHHQEVYQPMIHINDSIKALGVIDQTTCGKAVWNNILSEISTQVVAKRKYKFTLCDAEGVCGRLIGVSQETKFTAKTKLPRLRDKFMKFFFNPFSRLQGKYVISQKLHLMPMKIEIEDVA